MDFPVFKVKISEDLNGKEEVDFISLVDKPAIQSDFLKFSERIRFEVSNEEEQIVTGLALIADLPIYRRDKDGNEFYVVFEAPTVKQIAQRFFMKQYNANINADHNPEKVVDAYFFESWIVERDKGKLPMKGFEDIANGSWFVSAKINNPATWQDVKDGKFKGFSVEGFFNLEPFTKQEREEKENIELIEEILQLLKK